MRRLAAVLVLAGCTGRVEPGEVPPGPPGTGDSRTCPAEKRATWRPVSEEGFPAAPGRTLLLWTGTEVLAAVDDSVPKALYDPCADRWREVIPPPDGFRYGLLALGQGELFIYRDFEDILAVYDYASNRGRRPPTTGAHLATLPLLVPAGRRLIVWGGQRGVDRLSGSVNEGAVFTSGPDHWRAMTTTGAPSPRIAPGVWTGRHFAVWGGRSGEWDLDRNVFCPQTERQKGCPHFGDGALYDPERDRWTPIALAGAPSPRHEHFLGWTGRELLVWGGRGEVGENEPAQVQVGMMLTDGALYDPDKQTWRPVAPANPRVSQFSTFHWVGTRMVVVEDGLGTWIYDPATDRWSPPLAPPTESCGAEVRVQAGALLTLCHHDGRGVIARLDPVAARWTTIELPERAGPPYLWTGQRLIVWGTSTDSGRCGAPGSNCLPPNPEPVKNAWILTP